MTKKSKKTERLAIRGVSSRFLTVKQLADACKKHSYILARMSSGYQIGLNTKVAAIAQKRKEYHPDNRTDFVSFLPCDFNTYITHKHKFC